MNIYKFMSRLIVGFSLIILAGVMVFNIVRTVAIPRLPLAKGATYVQDVSGRMSEPDKGYAYNAIKKAATENKIAIVLDYQLTTFDITDSYIQEKLGTIVDRIYTNQPYVIYTYFKDTETLVISTNVNDASNDLGSRTKTEIVSDAKVVKEILYYQQNLHRGLGLKNWNFSLTSDAMRCTILRGVGSIIFLILGFGVLPFWFGEKAPLSFKKKNGKRKHDVTVEVQ